MLPSLSLLLILAAPAAPTDAQIIERLIVESQKAGFERGDVEGYFAPWVPNGRWISARGPEAGPFDLTTGPEAARARALLRGAAPTGFKMRHEEIKVEIEGDQATTRLILFIEGEGYTEKNGEVYRLERRGGSWWIVENRFWPLAQRVGWRLKQYTPQLWAQLDAAVDAARRSGDKRAELDALFEAARWREAWEATQAWVKAAPHDAAAWGYAAQAGYMTGRVEEAKAAVRRARALEPALPLPPWTRAVE